jgi:integrase
MKLRLFAPEQPGGPATTPHVVVEYQKHLDLRVRQGALKEQHQRLRRDTLNDFAVAFADRPADSITQDDLDNWVLAHTGWTSPHTQVHRAGIIVTCFRWAAKREFVSKCRLERGRWGMLKPRSPITPEQFWKIIAATKRPANGHHWSRRAFRWYLLALWATGARTCELREACWQDLDLERRLISLDAHKTASTGERRTIVLTQSLCRALRRIKRLLGPLPQDRLFVNARGTPWTKEMIGRHFRFYAEVAGCGKGVTPYSLRHGFCVRCLDAGLGERQIADLMGQKTTRYVSWYGQSAGRRVEYLKNLLDQVDD